jgi:hypothetical protein
MIALIQIIGVFIASFSGLACIAGALLKNNVPYSVVLFFAIGMTMALCGFFIK